VPRRAKWPFLLLIPYLASPIDLIPDFIPILGQLDDAALVVPALRRVLRLVSREVVRDLWPGSERGLCALLGATA
jgi:uncharacterized membrane protein YkvA (DUF1232 family)